MKQLSATTLTVFLLATAQAQAQQQQAQEGRQPTTQTPQQPIVQNFEELDQDGDGVINEQEADDENVWYHFDAVDRDKNRVLSQEEFVRYIREEDPLLGEELPTEELPQAVLRERTKQDSDVVTNPELLPTIRSDFESVDANGDRYMTRDEAGDDHIHDHFTHMDTNSDGYVSLTEYNRYLYEHGTQVATQELVDEVARQQ